MSPNGKSGFEETPQAKGLLDQLLKGKSATYKAKVRDLVLKNGWDVNDPSFAILIATGKLEVLLDLFPEQFEVLFERLLEVTKQQFLDVKGWVDAQKSDIRDYLQGLQAAGDQLVAGVSGQVDELKALTEQRQGQLRAHVSQVLSLAKEQRDQVRQELAEQFKVAQKAHLVSLDAQAKTLIVQAGDVLRLEYLKELFKWGAIAGLVFTGLGIAGGWMLHRYMMGALDPAGPRQLSLEQWQRLEWAVSKDGQLAQHLMEWNESGLQECIAGNGLGNESLGLSGYEHRPVKYGICALWVVPPDKREFGEKPDK